MGSGQGKYLYLLDKVRNTPIFKGLKRCFWRWKDQFKAGLILKSYFKDAIVSLRWLEKGKLRTALLAIEFLRTQKFSTSGSYFLCEVPPVRFYLWQGSLTDHQAVCNGCGKGSLRAGIWVVSIASITPTFHLARYYRIIFAWVPSPRWGSNEASTCGEWVCLKLRKPVSPRYDLRVRLPHCMVLRTLGFVQGFSWAECHPKMRFVCRAQKLMHYSGWTMLSLSIRS